MTVPVRSAASPRSGFTLIEILVVVALVALLATVGVVQLQRARVTTYEQLALASLRTMSRACEFFALANQRYPDNLTALGPPSSNPSYLEPDMIGNGTTVTTRGYMFTYAPQANGANFTLLADPEAPGVTGVRHFYTDQDSAIHANAAGPAGASDPVISQ